MLAPFVRRVVSSVTAALVVLGLAASAGAVTDINTCDPPVINGKARLVNDLDCSGTPAVNIVMNSGRLDLNGHTLVTGTNYGVLCAGSCKIIGPGTITGAGSGVDSSKALLMRDVTVSLTDGGIGAAAVGKLTLDGVTISGAVLGAIGGKGVKVTDSTITAAAVGLQSGAGSMTDGPCTQGSVSMRRSSVTGTTAAYCDGSEPPAICADVLSCKRPKVAQSTCNTSCQAGAGVPCPTWGVCAAD